MAGAILSLPSKWASERYFQSCTKYSVTEATALPRKQVETSCFGGTPFDPRRGSSIIWSLLSQKSCLKGGPIIYLSLIHISEPTRRTPISYAVFCLNKKQMFAVS